MKYIYNDINFNQYNHIHGLSSNLCQLQDNKFIIPVNLLEEYDDNLFILNTTFYRKKDKVYVSYRNVNYGTFVLNAEHKLFFTYGRSSENCIIYDFIGSDNLSSSDKYQNYQLIILL